MIYQGNPEKTDMKKVKAKIINDLDTRSKHLFTHVYSILASVLHDMFIARAP